MVKIVLLMIAPFVLMGTTYKIVEPDVMSEAEGRQQTAVKKVEREAKNQTELIKKLKGEVLSKAPKSFSYYVDPTYTLQQDIPKVDRNGNVIGILYPKGYVFNPLEYIRMAPPPIVAFDACNKKELEIAKKLVSGRPDAMFASSGCGIEDFPKNIDRQMFLVTKEMKEKFELKYTVSMITVDLKAKRIKVEVYKASN